MHLLLRPAQSRPAARLRPGLPDPVDPLRPDQPPQAAGPSPRTTTARPGPDAGPPVRGRRQNTRRPERLLPAHGRAGGLRPAVAPEGTEPVDAGIDVLERVHRFTRRARRAIPLPRADPGPPVSTAEVPQTTGCAAHVDHDRSLPDVDLLSPLALRGVTLRNRIGVSPM